MKRHGAGKDLMTMRKHGGGKDLMTVKKHGGGKNLMTMKKHGGGKDLMAMKKHGGGKGLMTVWRATNPDADARDFLVDMGLANGEVARVSRKPQMQSRRLQQQKTVPVSIILRSILVVALEGSLTVCYLFRNREGYKVNCKKRGSVLSKEER